MPRNNSTLVNNTKTKGNKQARHAAQEERATAEALERVNCMLKRRDVIVTDSKTFEADVKEMDKRGQHKMVMKFCEVARVRAFSSGQKDCVKLNQLALDWQKQYQDRGLLKTEAANLTNTTDACATDHAARKRSSTTDIPQSEGSPSSSPPASPPSPSPVPPNSMSAGDEAAHADARATIGIIPSSVAPAAAEEENAANIPSNTSPNPSSPPNSEGQPSSSPSPPSPVPQPPSKDHSADAAADVHAITDRAADTVTPSAASAANGQPLADATDSHDSEDAPRNQSPTTPIATSAEVDQPVSPPSPPPPSSPLHGFVSHSGDADSHAHANGGVTSSTAPTATSQRGEESANKAPDATPAEASTPNPSPPAHIPESTSEATSRPSP